MIAARRAARTLRLHMPDAEIDFYTNKLTGDPVFNQEHGVDGWFRPKIAAMRRSRFERTVYLDSDIFALLPVPELFDTLDNCDLAASVGITRRPAHLREKDKISRAFPVFNSGVMCIKRNATTERFLEEWETQMRAEGDPADQGIMRKLIYRGDVRFLPLGYEYNVKQIVLIDLWTEMQGAPRLLHASRLNRKPHADPMTPVALDEVLNSRQRTRLDVLMKVDRHLEHARPITQADVDDANRVLKETLPHRKAQPANAPAGGSRPRDSGKAHIAPPSSKRRNAGKMNPVTTHGLLRLSEDIGAFLPRFAAEVVLDVGAQAGGLSDRLLALFPHATVHTCAASRQSFDKLNDRYGTNARVKLYQATLGPETVRSTAAATGTMTSDARGTNAAAGPEADTTSGDAFCKTQSIAEISYLRVSGGAESLDVLKGFSTMLAQEKIGLVQVECGMNRLNEFHASLGAVQSFMQAKGYELFGLYNQLQEFSRRPVLRRCDAVFIAYRTAETNSLGPPE